MVKRIVWSKKATLIFQKILEFYFLRNGNKSFSRKLNTEIKNRIKVLKKYPFLGIETNIENVRYLISSHYKIFYLIDKEMILILLVWDARQNPKDLQL